MELRGFLGEQLQAVSRNCQRQQEGLRAQKNRLRELKISLRLQQMKLSRALTETAGNSRAITADCSAAIVKSAWS
jgi:hypothetical protein